MPISFDDAYAATNPSDTDEKRKASAEAIVAGTAANEAYWDSRSQLEALKARADGHGVVTRGGDESTQVAGGGASEPAIEGTATEEPAEIASPSSTNDSPPVSPVNETEAVAKLRAQIVAAGGTPEA